MTDNYEDYLYREQCEGPVHWCSQCERDAEDCVCEEISDHFRTLGGHADSDDVGNNVIPCVPLSLSAPPPSENALTEFDLVANNLAAVPDSPTTEKEKSDIRHRGPARCDSGTAGRGDVMGGSQTPVQILNKTFTSVMRRFKI